MINRNHEYERNWDKQVSKNATTKIVTKIHKQQMKREWNSGEGENTNILAQEHSSDCLRGHI